METERAARSHKGVSQVEDTVYSDAEGSVALANSRGFCRLLRGHAAPRPTRPRSRVRAPTS